MPHKHLPYILACKWKNVGQNLALKTRGRLIHVSSFGQRLLQVGWWFYQTASMCQVSLEWIISLLKSSLWWSISLVKSSLHGHTLMISFFWVKKAMDFSMAAYASQWVIVVAKCWPNASKVDLCTVMADDIASAADAPTLTGKKRRSSPVVLARHLRPRTTQLLATTTSSQVAVAASRHCLHATGCFATATCPVWTSSPADQRWRSGPSMDLYKSNFGRFWRPRRGWIYMRIDLYESIYCTWIFM